MDKLVLVVGHQGGQILDYVGERGDFETVVSVEQGEPIGLAHAVSLAGPSVGTDPLLVVYGDTVFEADLAEVVRRGGDGLLGVRKVEAPRRFGGVGEESGRVLPMGRTRGRRRSRRRGTPWKRPPGRR